MKIVCIFADRLFSFQYEGEVDNEYDRLLDLWNDKEYLYGFFKENIRNIPSGKSIIEMVLEISNDAEFIDDTLKEMAENPDKTLSYFFRPLHNQEYGLHVLSLQKGRRNYLRLYAIKIDNDTFVITGGAIKLTRTMQESYHTLKELDKLKKAKDFLRDNGVFDDDSFDDFIKEEND